ncbi:metal-sulfur cluster assembly factor [Pontibacter ruber]|uniref:Metal-sulfur cluster assembly factor n=1 Tax=Pontibacter ruber TaxID=1343895 RepID=A0ABW5CS16_9BACT|nr:metal-sulfur cluster assembly factor [Pontibacter ruber]
MEAQEQQQLSEKVYESLKYIIDPEIGINIVDLGLVYKVALQEEQKLYVELTLTTPGCPMSSTIIKATEQLLALHYPEYQAHVELVWLPQWTPEMISEEGMRLLGND